MAFGFASGQSLRTLEAANLFCGTGPSNHLRLLNVKLPVMQETYLDYHPGGAPVAIEIDVVLNKLSCDFTLAGWTPEVDILLAAWLASSNMFWMYGALRDRVTGNLFQAEAKMFGRLGHVEQEAFQRGATNQFKYTIRGIISYQLSIAGAMVYDFDFFNNRFLVGQASNAPNPVIVPNQVT